MSRKNGSILELRVINILRVNKFQDPIKEYVFHPIRKWRFDFAYIDQKIAIECEGGIWSGGAHVRGSHFNSDCEKYNEAVKLGWKILRYTTNTLNKIPEDLICLLKN